MWFSCIFHWFYKTMQSLLSFLFIPFPYSVSSMHDEIFPLFRTFCDFFFAVFVSCYLLLFFFCVFKYTNCKIRFARIEKKKKEAKKSISKDKSTHGNRVVAKKNSTYISIYTRFKLLSTHKKERVSKPHAYTFRFEFWMEISIASGSFFFKLPIQNLS